MKGVIVNYQNTLLDVDKGYTFIRFFAGLSICVDQCKVQKIRSGVLWIATIISEIEGIPAADKHVSLHNQ